MAEHNKIDLIEFPATSAEELTATRIFFNRVFGWEFKTWGDTYADTQDSGAASGINANAEGRQTMPLAVIYVDDIESAKQKVIDGGGSIVQDITPFPGGRRFHFTDPAGNELAAWSK